MEQPPPLPQPSPLPPPLPKPKSNNRAVVIVISILIAGIVLVGLLAALVIPKIAKEASKSKVLSSADGKLQISVPGTWSKLQLNENADLQAGNKFAETYVMVISENKEELPDDMTIEDHSEVTRQAIVDSIKRSKVSDPGYSVIDGTAAVQYEVSGTIDNVDITYLHTTLEDKDQFHQILAWTLRSRYAKHKDKLKEVISSFKSTAAKIEKSTEKIQP